MNTTDHDRAAGGMILSSRMPFLTENHTGVVIITDPHKPSAWDPDPQPQREALFFNNIREAWGVLKEWLL